jgi:hypothetical protein
MAMVGFTRQNACKNSLSLGARIALTAFVGSVIVVVVWFVVVPSSPT